MDKKRSTVNNFRTRKILSLSLGIFFLLIISFIVQGTDILPLIIFPSIAILGFLFLILGGYIIFLAHKENGKLKFLLMITGISAIAPFLGSILHNVFYALAIVFPSFAFFFETLHVAFFLISLIVAPITFVICAIYSLILLHQKKY